MKSLRISATEKVIEIEYKNPQTARKVFDELPNFEQERCCLNSADLTYDLTNVEFKNIILIVRNLFCKSFKDGKIKHNHLDIQSKVLKCSEAIIEEGKLFKVTLINNDGTIGKYGFGCWQYGRILNLNDYVLDTFEVTLRNSNLDENTHKIRYSEDIDVLIEIGEIQF